MKNSELEDLEDSNLANKAAKNRLDQF